MSVHFSYQNYTFSDISLEKTYGIASLFRHFQKVFAQKNFATVFSETT